MEENQQYQQKILTQLIQVLQEVAASRHVLIKCGATEIDGYAFCSGISALKPYEAFPELQSRIRSVVYLIMGAAFRPRYETNRSLNIRPLSVLVDMYHTRKSTEPLDKVYALLGMSSDDPSAAGLLTNYEISWKEVFRKLVTFSLSDQMSVDTWDKKEVAVIRGSSCILGEVSSVRRDSTRDDRETVAITWKHAPSPLDTKGEQISHVALPSLSKPIQVGDVVCLLQGASNPTIVRLCNEYSTVIMVQVPLTEALQAKNFEGSELLQSIKTFPDDLLLVWDWDASRGRSHSGEGYEDFMSSQGVPKCLRTEWQDHLDKATRL